MTFLPLQESSLFHFNQIQIFINREKNLTHWNFYLLKFVISDSIFHFVFFFFFLCLETRRPAPPILTTPPTTTTTTTTTTRKAPRPPSPPGPCRVDQATCQSGECIPRDYICDGERDCSDGSDEFRCGGSAATFLSYIAAPTAASPPFSPAAQAPRRRANPTSSSARTAAAPSSCGAATETTTARTTRTKPTAVSVFRLFHSFREEMERGERLCNWPFFPAIWTRRSAPL